MEKWKYYIQDKAEKHTFTIPMCHHISKTTLHNTFIYLKENSSKLKKKQILHNDITCIFFFILSNCKTLLTKIFDNYTDKKNRELNGNKHKNDTFRKIIPNV